MASETLQWSETKEYMDQMMSMFRYDDGEKEVLNEIQAIRQQITDGLRRKEGDVRQRLRSACRDRCLGLVEILYLKFLHLLLIRGAADLARQVESEESEGSQSDAIAAVRAEMEEADRQHAAVTAELNRLIQVRG